MTIYIDESYICHAADNGAMRGFELPFFDGKSPDIIGGYRYIPAGEQWRNEKGTLFCGEAIFPWKNSRQLLSLQREYEQARLLNAHSEIARLKDERDELRAELVRADAALNRYAAVYAGAEVQAQ